MIIRPPVRPSKESEERVQSLRRIKPPAHIHVSGICGTGVSAVAVLLKDLGYRVTGTDKAFYPPMGEVARNTAEKLYEGYRAENLHERPDAVIIGNNLSRNNPEVEYVLQENIPYASMPEAFNALLIGTREECKTSIVVSGTHGKTTTTAAIGTLLDKAGLAPGYFVGGIPIDLPGNVRKVDRTRPLSERFVVLEGDEYDSAYFAKWSKFHSYRPDIAVVTSLEFDHADIFETVAEIEEEFLLFLKKVPSTGSILVCDSDERLVQLVEKWRDELEAPVYFYGEREGSAFRLLERASVYSEEKPKQELSFDLRGVYLMVRSPLTGPHNAMNLLATAAVGYLCGLTPDQLIHGIAEFNGVLRRQRVLGEFNSVLVIEDFAHHPSAVKLTLQGLKEAYPERRLVALFEPRSNTSRRNYFQKEYEAAFSAADVTHIVQVQDAGGYSSTGAGYEPLNVNRIVQRIRAEGRSAEISASTDELLAKIIESAAPGDLICLMSNGDFGGLPQKLPAALSSLRSPKG